MSIDEFATVGGRSPTESVRAPAVSADPINDRQSFSRVAQTIDVRQNLTSKILAGLFAALVLSVLAGLWLGRFSKFETVRGYVATSGGFSRLDAPQAGVIREIFVKQGDTVTVGQPVYALRLREATSGGETTVAAEMRNLEQTRLRHVAEVARLEAFLTQAEIEKHDQLREEKALLEALDRQEASIQRALGNAQSVVQRLRRYVETGYATRDNLESHERVSFDYERQLSEIHLKRIEYKRLKMEKERQLASLIADKLSQKTAAENAISSIDSKLASVRADSALVVQAQSDGTVLALMNKVGDSVQPGQFIAGIGAPDSDLIVILDAPARAVGLARIGQRVVLKYDAFPFKTFGVYHGTIKYISSAAFNIPTSLRSAEGADPRPLPLQSEYRIEVQPDEPSVIAYGQKRALTVGATLTAEIVVENRRLIDWVLDPIRAMRGRG